MPRFRLPAALGGGEITARYDGYSMGQHHYLGGHVEGFGGVELALAHQLEEILPPSVDDPVEWPLEISHPDTHGGVWFLTLKEPTPLVANLGAACLVIATPECKEIGILLSVEELRDLARAAWQRANEIERAS